MMKVKRKPFWWIQDLFQTSILASFFGIEVEQLGHSG